MRTITIKRSQIIFGALVVTLGFSKSWLNTTEQNTFGSQSLAQTSASTAAPTLVQEFNVTVDGENKKIFAHISNRTSTTSGGATIVDGKVVATSGTTQTGLQARFTDSTGCSTCIGIDPLMMANIQNLEQAVPVLTDYIKNQVETKVKQDKEQKELQAAIDSCDKAKDGDKVIDLKKSENRRKRIECLADKVEANEDDREAFRKLRKAIGRDVMKYAQSEDADDRQEAIELLEDLESKFSGNTSLERYLKKMREGAKDYNQITELAQQSAQNPLAQMQNGQYIDYLAGKWNPARFQGMSQATIMGVTDWQNPMASLARQAQRNPQIVARQYFEGSDSDIGVIDSIGMDLLDPSLGRAPRQNIGQQYIPVWESFNQRNTGRNNYSSYPGNNTGRNRFGSGSVYDQRRGQNTQGYDTRFSEDPRFRNDNRHGSNYSNDPRFRDDQRYGSNYSNDPRFRNDPRRSDRYGR